MTRPLRELNPLLPVTVALMGVTLWMVFFWVPTEVNQGPVQRIFYVHVPVAWVSMVAIVVVAAASLAYLRTRKEGWDRLAAAVAEVGLVFGAGMLISGMIWARPVWGVWWTGEAKLTTALILFFIYVAYLMFRAYFPPGEQRMRLAAIIAVIGAVDAPIIYYAANLWQQAHPPAVIGPASDPESAVASDIGITLLVSVFAFTFLFIYLTMERYRLRKAEDQVTRLRREASGTPGPASRMLESAD